MQSAEDNVDSLLRNQLQFKTQLNCTAMGLQFEYTRTRRVRNETNAKENISTAFFGVRNFIRFLHSAERKHLIIRLGPITFNRSED